MPGSAIDIFGRSAKRSLGSTRGLPGVGFNLTPEGHYDLRERKLCKVADPIDPQDAATKSFVEKTLDSRVVTQGDNDLSIKKRRLVDVGEPMQDTDAVTKGFLESSSLCVDAKNAVFDAKSKRLTNLAPPSDNNDAVNLNHLHEHAICKKMATLQDPKTKADFETLMFDAKNLPITNMADPQTPDCAVTSSFMTDGLKHLGVMMMHEIADLAINFRKELYKVAPRSTKSKDELLKHFNSIESSISRSWRAALELPEDYKRVKYSRDELKKSKFWDE